MSVELCAVVLAAGEGTRLRPLTDDRPKALCPVGNVPLLDRALARLAGAGFAGPLSVAVNACHYSDQVVEHVAGRAHVSVEPWPDALGTAGGLGKLRHWIDGRGVLVGNADAYLAHEALAPGPDIAALLADWDGQTVRILGVAADEDGVAEFGGHRFAGFSLLPWADVQGLEPEYADLVRTVWRPAEAAGRLEVVEYGGAYLDTGTPAGYLAANLHSTGGGNVVDASATVTGDVVHSVVGAGAVVAGSVTRCVVWPGAQVDEGEQLADAVRVGKDLTVKVS